MIDFVNTTENFRSARGFVLEILCKKYNFTSCEFVNFDNDDRHLEYFKDDNQNIPLEAKISEDEIFQILIDNLKEFENRKNHLAEYQYKRYLKRADENIALKIKNNVLKDYKDVINIIAEYSFKKL